MGACCPNVVLKSIVVNVSAAFFVETCHLAKALACAFELNIE